MFYNTRIEIATERIPLSVIVKMAISYTNNSLFLSVSYEDFNEICLSWYTLAEQLVVSYVQQ